MAPQLVLVSHPLCPFVQRAVIALSEKRVPFTRIDVDLAAKPAWFQAISPLGKVPLLRAGEAVLFESAVILEYLEETQSNPLHPASPLQRADHRAWIDFGSTVLADIAGLYAAVDELAFRAKVDTLRAKFARLEARLGRGPWFDGERFSLVDAAFGPVFRYFDAFDRIGGPNILDGLSAVARWRAALALRPSVARAVAADYAAQLDRFLASRGSYLGGRFMERAAA